MNLQLHECEQHTTVSGRAEHAMLRAIRWYQSLRPGHPSPCRFFPSCSEYAYEAIETFGPRAGGWLMVKRLSRCRPFGPSGFDPVPTTEGIDQNPSTVRGTVDVPLESR
jgi:putative membrane protein insertion efficiency factor